MTGCPLRRLQELAGELRGRLATFARDEGGESAGGLSECNGYRLRVR
jgi:hypothetical protein